MPFATFGGSIYHWLLIVLAIMCMILNWYEYVYLRGNGCMVSALIHLWLYYMAILCVISLWHEGRKDWCMHSRSMHGNKTWDFDFMFTYNTCTYTGNDLNGKAISMPVRKPYGAAVYPLYDVLNSDLQKEVDVQMDIYACVSLGPPSYLCYMHACRYTFI